MLSESDNIVKVIPSYTYSFKCNCSNCNSFAIVKYNSNTAIFCISCRKYIKHLNKQEKRNLGV